MKHKKQQNLRVGNLIQITSAGDFTVKPDWILGPRKLDEFELVYFPSGSHTCYQAGDQIFTLSNSHFILTPPDEEHSYRFDPNESTRHLFIHFTAHASIQEMFSSLVSTSSLVLPASGATIIPVIIKHILNLCSSKPIHWEERCNAFLFTLIGEIQTLSADRNVQQNDGAIPYQINKSLEFIFQKLNDPLLSVTQIADFLGWSHAHFTRQFVKHVGISPREKILNSRIEQACQLLIQEKRNIKEISYAVGFRDEHYFSRAFMKVKGLTATHFREKFTNPLNLHLAAIDDSQTSYLRNHYFLLSSDPQIK